MFPNRCNLLLIPMYRMQQVTTGTFYSVFPITIGWATTVTTRLAMNNALTLL